MIQPPPVLLPLLIPLSWLYGAVVGLRARIIEHRSDSWFDQLEKPVLSIGNLTVGGTGKTPFTELCARILMEEGFRVAVLSRGYGREGRGPRIVSEGEGLPLSWKEAGDEPALLASRVPGLIVAVAERRAEAGKILQSRTDLGIDVFLLDDGFQHRRLRRQLDIVLLRSDAPFGNNRLLPAGPLRESKSALKRADVIVLTGSRLDSGETILSTLSERSLMDPSTPIFKAASSVEGLRTIGGKAAEAIASLKDAPVLALSGIANPDSFLTTLETLGVDVVCVQSFKDHHAYSEENMQHVYDLAKSSGARWILTTEKDAERMTEFSLPDDPPLRSVAIATCVERPGELKNLLLKGIAGE